MNISKLNGNYAIKLLMTLLYIVCPLCWLLPFLGLPQYGKLFKNRVTSFFNRYILPPAAVILVFSYAFKQNDIYPFGAKTIAWCDLTQQGVPYWMNFKSIIEGDDSIFLNMANAGGMDAWSLLRGVFLSPFSYIALFLERYAMMDFITVLQVLKLAACSCTAMVFFKLCLKKLNPSIAVSLSIMYSFCAYGGMYYQILLWPDIMYTLPLFAAGIYLLIKRGKIGLYAVSLAMMMNSFMMGFMIVIATVLFFGYYTIINDAKDNKRIIFNFIVGSVWAAFLSAFTWLPFFSAYNSSARGESLSENLKNISFFTKKETVYPLLMSSGFIFVSVFSAKSVVKGRLAKTMMFLFAIMCAAMVFEPFNAMWHGGSYMSFPARFAYIIVFLGLAIGGILFSDAGHMDICNDGAIENKKDTARYAIFTLLLVAFVGFVGKSALDYTTSNIAFLDNYVQTLWGNAESYKYQTALLLMFVIMYAICYLFYKKKLVPKRIIPVVLLAVVLLEAICTVNIYFVPARSKVNTESFRQYADMADRIEDEDFYRVKNTSFLRAAYSISEANFPGAIGYNSMGHYSSLASETYLYFAKALGYSSVWMKIESFGGTKFSDAVMAVRYSIGKVDNGTDSVYKNDKYQINRLSYSLPLGQFTPLANVDTDLYKVTRIELQEQIFDAYTGDKYDLFTEHIPTAKNCFYTHADKTADGKYVINKQGSNKAALEYTVNVKGTQTIYLDCFDDFSNELSEKIYGAFRITLNGKRVDRALTNKDYYPSDSYNGILNLGTFTDTTVTVSLEVLENVKCRSFGLFTMNDGLLEEHIDKISTAKLDVDGNEISGTYTSNDDGYLIVAVPYDAAYECKVNGKIVNAVKAFGGLMALPVSAGGNSIELSFTSPMFYDALALVLLGVALGVIGLIFIYRKKRENIYDAVSTVINDKLMNTLLKIGEFCVTLAFVAVLIVVYLYPAALKLWSYWI